jgi:hypothetical protein
MTENGNLMTAEKREIRDREGRQVQNCRECDPE